MADVSDHKSPVDPALDPLVYAPIGLALDARTLLPQLIDRGRSQVTLARMMGEFAVGKGQKGASRRLSKVQEQALTALAELGLLDNGTTNGRGPVVTTTATAAPAAAAAP